MRSFKDILGVLIVAVGLSPVATYAASVTINGASVPFTAACGTGTATCALTPGDYNGAVLGGSPTFSSSDGTITDTLRFTNYTITPDVEVTNVTITYSQSYTNGTGGTYSYGNYQGGFFTGTLRTGNYSLMDGSIIPLGAGTTTQPELCFTVGTTRTSVCTSPAGPLNIAQNTNSFQQSTAATSVVCNNAGVCAETLSATIHLSFGSGGTFTVTNSDLVETKCSPDGPCFADPEGLAADFAAEAAADAAVPEPATLLLLGTGLAGIFAFGRKRLLTRA